MTKKILIALIIFAALVMVSFTYLYQRTRQNKIDAQTIVATSTQAQASNTTTTPNISLATTTATTTELHPGMKLYRNEKFGFEFWYPEGWEIKENTFGNPGSKFNLVAHTANSHPFYEPLMINIVTVEFAKREYQDIENQAALTMVNNIKSTIYQYQEEMMHTDIIIPISVDTSIIIANEDDRYAPEFNKILSTIKFLK